MHLQLDLVYEVHPKSIQIKETTTSSKTFPKHFVRRRVKDLLKKALVKTKMLPNQNAQNSKSLKVKDTQGQTSSSSIRAEIQNSRSTLRAELILDQNPDSLRVNCTEVQVPSL